MQMKLKQWIAVGLLAAGSSAALAGLVSEVPVTVTLNADGSGSVDEPGDVDGPADPPVDGSGSED